MRAAALGAAAAALLVAKGCLALAPGRTVRIAARVNNPRDPRLVSDPCDPCPANSARIRDLCRAVTAIAARPPFFATCLEQSVALVMLLRVTRTPANLIVGVTRTESVFRAHAWVECGGVVALGGAQAQGLAPLLGTSHATISSRPSAVSASCPG